VPKGYAAKTPAQRRMHSKKRLLQLAKASKGKSVKTPHVVKAVKSAKAEFKDKRADILYKVATTPKKKPYGPSKPTKISRKKAGAQDTKQLQDRLEQEKITKTVRRKR